MIGTPRRFCCRFFLVAVLASCGLSQMAQTWEHIRDRFVATNPTLIAGRIEIDQSRAAEITAFLRPNPNFTGTIDQINPFSTQPPPSGSGGSSYRPFAFALPSASISYLHERQHKRELRRDSAPILRPRTAMTLSNPGGICASPATASRRWSRGGAAPKSASLRRRTLRRGLAGERVSARRPARVHRSRVPLALARGSQWRAPGSRP